MGPRLVNGVLCAATSAGSSVTFLNHERRCRWRGLFEIRLSNMPEKRSVTQETSPQVPRERS